MNDVMPRDSAGQTHPGDAPPRVAYLTLDAEVHSAEVPSSPQAGDHVLDIAHRWLRPRIFGDALESLCWAARDFALWFATHEGREPFMLTLGWEDPRVLITLQDHGTRTPDLHRSRMDAAMIFRNLGHHVTEWDCTVSGDGIRTAHIYGDVTADQNADPEEWPE